MKRAILILVLLAMPVAAEETKALELGDRFDDTGGEVSFQPPKGWERKKPKRGGGIVYVGPERGEMVLRMGYSIRPHTTGDVAGDLVDLGDMKARRVALPIRLSTLTVFREEYRVLRKVDMLTVWFERPEKAEDVAELFKKVRGSFKDWQTLIETPAFSFRLPDSNWAEGWKFPKGYEALAAEAPADVAGIAKATIHHATYPAIIRMIHVTTAKNPKMTLDKLRDQYVRAVANHTVVMEKDREKNRPVDGEKALITPWHATVEKDGKKTVVRRGYLVVIRKSLSFYATVVIDYGLKFEEKQLEAILFRVLTSTKLK